MAGFPALLLLLALTGTSVEQDIEVQKKVQGDSLHTGCSYNKHKYSLEKKYLCKELSRNCPVLASISPAGGKNDPHPATKNTISLKDTGYGWISVIMMALRVEDSGTYQCKLYDSLKSIILKRIKVLVAYEAPLRLSANEGDSISLNCSYTVMGERRSHQYFTLCKMVTTTNCQPAIRMNYYYNVHTSGKIRITNDQENYMITATLRQLRYQDSGEYRCCSHFMSQNMFLRAIHLVVSKKPWNPSSVLEVTSSPTSSRGAIHPTVASNEQQRTLYIVVVLGVLLASVALITAFTLLALTFIKRREAEDGLSFGRTPGCRLAVFQKDESSGGTTSDGEMESDVTYAVLKCQTKPEPENVNAKVKAKPKASQDPTEPGAVTSSFGLVEYATVIFGTKPPPLKPRNKQIRENPVP
ncbi:triggering receptor expressed on myeloid cells B1 isoform A [Alligator mississippiensis]|uniref:Triggering receptor expressed on myeloid cells B1 isoform A n=1 Tax=Alligator mississippiensis TaxID=8496 RepID=A0A151P4P7_ALLMI|nr:triggering receptor expressed on myeloid cells B1 isoform A [Alligator mississippiensis]